MVQQLARQFWHDSSPDSALIYQQHVVHNLEEIPLSLHFASLEYRFVCYDTEAECKFL